MSAAVERPGSAKDVASLVTEACHRQQAIEIAGGGSKSGFGRPVEAQIRLETSGLSGIALYEPAELVIAAQAGTPLRIVNDLLAQKRQMLPFEPPDYRRVLATGGEPTIGGMVAGNLSGPRRLLMGACRDAIIGCKFINGRGEEIMSGGRVMKNVTGYDIGRAMAGAHGTLGVLTEITFKVLPRAEHALTLVYGGLDDVGATALMRRAAASPYEISGAAHVTGPSGPKTYIRLEGFEASITYRAGRLGEDLDEFGRPTRLNDGESTTLWRDIGDVTLLGASPGDAVWKVQAPATKTAAMVEELRVATPLLRTLYDWAGGLVWLAVEEGTDAACRQIRAAAAAVGGHATLVRASEATRRSIPPFEPQTAAVELLSRRLKQAFDPAGILNPGRMYAGF